MKLICSQWCAGVDLVCELLNGTDTVENYGGLLNNPASTYFDHYGYEIEPGQIYDQKFWGTKLLRLRMVKDSAGVSGTDNWYGTGVHPKNIDEATLSMFDKVTVITTENYWSKFYRYLRMKYCIPEYSYMFYAEKSAVPFIRDSRFDHIEMEDIVSGKYIEDNNLDQKKFDQWKKINSFLYVQPKYNVLKSFNQFINLYPTGYNYRRWWN